MGERASVDMKGLFCNKRNNGYGIKGIDGKLFHGGNRPVRGLRGVQYEDFMQITEGDKIEVVLDLDWKKYRILGDRKGTLSFHINGVDYGYAFAVDATVSYRLCV